MIVVGIIAILVGLGANYVRGSLEYAQQVKVKADVATLSTQLKTYQMQNQFLPSSDQGLQALVVQPQGDPQPQHWIQFMDKLPLDPWGHAYQYRNPGIFNTNSFDVYSLGPDGLDNTADDIGNWDAAPTQ